MAERRDLWGHYCAKGSTEKHTHHVPQDKPPTRPRGRQDRGHGSGRGGTSQRWPRQQAGTCQSPKGGTWRTGHVQPEREHGRGGPKGKSQKESHLVRKPNSQPPEATGHAPTPSACYGSSSERLRETKSLESGSRDFRRERGQPPEAVDKVPLGGFQVGSLETYCVGDTRQVLFLLNVSESHLDGSNDLVTSRTFLLWQ